MQNGGLKNFYIACVVVLLFLFTKTSGLILVVLTLTALLLKVFLEMPEKEKIFFENFMVIAYRREIVAFFLISVLGLATISYKNFFYFEKKGELTQNRVFSQGQ